jgi:hypothetical protein
MEIVKTVFQDPETMLWQVDGKELTERQIKSLQNLFPSVRWILIGWYEPKSRLLANEK